MCFRISFKCLLKDTEGDPRYGHKFHQRKKQIDIVNFLRDNKLREIYMNFDIFLIFCDI